jgi:peptide/nickel transport system substrate-binding protein
VRKAAAAALALLLTSGCARPPATSPTLVIACARGPQSLRPNANTDPVALDVLANLYQPLVEWDGSPAPRPRLAEAWAQEGPTTWRFRLRAGLRAQNGRDFTAADAVSSLHLARSDRSARRHELAGIRSIQARDARTLVIETDGPLPQLPLRLSRILMSASPATPGGARAGTGPYRVVAWTPGGDTVLEAAPDVHDGPVAITRVEWRVIPEAADRLRALREGRVQLVRDPPPEAMKELAAEPGLATAAPLGPAGYALGFDCLSASSPHVSTAANPFLDPRVREAVRRVLDRESLVRGPLRGFGLAAGGRPGDVEGSRTLLKEAGYPRGFTVSFDFEATGESEALAHDLAGELEAAGVRVTPRRNSAAELPERLGRRDAAMFLTLVGLDSGPADESAGDCLVPIARRADRYAFSRRLLFTPRADGKLRVDAMRWAR